MTKKRRCLIAAGVLAACVSVVLAVIAMLPPRPGVTKANFDRVEEGMSYAAVCEILGEDDGSFILRSGGTIQVWRHEYGATATIVFHKDAVADMSWIDSTETIADKLRRWLHVPK